MARPPAVFTRFINLGLLERIIGSLFRKSRRMPLSINLKPGEKLIVNGVVLQNAHHQATKLLVHNEAALLREKDIMTEEAATTPARRIYFAVQCHYLFPEKTSFY